MTEERNQLAELFAACWKDDALKQRFMADPKAVLAERGIEMPEGMNVTVVENNDNTMYITMPTAPTGAGNLSDAELINAAGGGCIYNTQYNTVHACPDWTYATVCKGCTHSGAAC